MDIPWRPYDQPREADTGDGDRLRPCTAQKRLAALAIHLEARNLDVELTGRHVIARNPNRPHITCTIFCRPRPDDAGRLWFYTASDGAIADAEKIIDAAVVISGFLLSDDIGDESP
jgi:hypothetical protein